MSRRRAMIVFVCLNVQMMALEAAAQEQDRCSVYTRKLDFELDTSISLFNRLPENNWLRNIDVEASLDYMATARQQAREGRRTFRPRAHVVSLQCLKPCSVTSRARQAARSLV